jgi:hypothetical protein
VTDSQQDRPPLRQLLLTAGVEVLERDGLGLGAQSLSYSRVFDHLDLEYGVRVTRASVHERIWDSHADFRRDVVARAMELLPTNPFGVQAEALRSAVLDMYTAGWSADQRAAGFARMFTPRALETLLSMPVFRDIQTAKAMASPCSDPLAAKVLHGPLAERAAITRAHFRDRMATITTGLGLRSRSELGLSESVARELGGSLVANLLIGAALETTAGADELLEPIDYRGHPLSHDQPWTILGLAGLGFLHLLFRDASEPSQVVIPDPPSPDNDPLPSIEVGNSKGRRSRGQLRDLVLAAGVEVLTRERLNLRPESLGYAQVFAHVEQQHGYRIHRSSIHGRIWASHDDYWLEVLTLAARNDQPTDPEPSVPPPSPRPDRSGPAPERAAATSFRRIAAEAVARQVTSRAALRRQAIKAALLTEPASPQIDALRRAIHEVRQAEVTARARTVSDVAAAHGFEVRPDHGVDAEQAARIVASVALTTESGATFDQSAGIEPMGRSFSIRWPDANGEPAGDGEDWTPPGLAGWSCFALLFHRPEASRAT